MIEQHQGAVMPFVSVPGLKGKVYAPEETRKSAKKHQCRDCFSCQQCSDDRCRVCLSLKLCSCGKQIKSKNSDIHFQKYDSRCNQL